MSEAIAWMWGFGGGCFVGLLIGAWLVHTSMAARCVRAAARGVAPAGKPIHEQMMAGYEVACRFGVLEKRAFDLSEQMWQAMSAAGVMVGHAPLADGFDGSTVRPGPNHSTIEIWYDTQAQARAAHEIIRDLIDAAHTSGVIASAELKENDRGNN